MSYTRSTKKAEINLNTSYTNFISPGQRKHTFYYKKKAFNWHPRKSICAYHEFCHCILIKCLPINQEIQKFWRYVQNKTV